MLIKHHNNITCKELSDYIDQNILEFSNSNFNIGTQGLEEFYQVQCKFTYDFDIYYDKLSQNQLNKMYNELKKLVKKWK